MDITLYSLMEYGLSKSIIEKNLLGEINYIDIFYPRRRFFESNVFNSSTNSKIIDLKKQNNLRLSPKAMDSIYILLKFGVSESTIEKFIHKSIKTISKLNSLSKFDKKNIINKSTDTEYENLATAIYEYKKWQKNNLEYLIQIFLLDYIQVKNTDNLTNRVKQKLYNLGIEITDSVIEDILFNLEKENIVKVTYSEVELENLSLRELLSYDMNDEDILNDKLSGKTFQETGHRLGKTRSRIQQQYSRLLTIIPDLVEDKVFANIYKNYKFTKEEFLTLVYDDEFTFYYLDSKYKNGRFSIQEYIEDYNISEDLVKNYLYSNNKFKNYNDEVMSINHRNIFDDYMRQNRKRKFDYDTSRSVYNQYCVKYNLEPYSDEQKRAFRGIVENSNKIVRSNDKTFRYYNVLGIGEIERALIKEAFEIPDGIYGAEKLYEINIDLMQTLNLENGYEFLDLVNMLKLEIPKLEKIVRRTEVQIGKLDKKKFIYEIFLDFNGENITDVIELISDEYGLKKNSLLSYVLDNFNNIIINNKINISVKDYNLEVLEEIIIDMLDEDLYLLRVFNQELSRRLGEDISVNNKILNPYCYRISGRYIINKKFKSHSEAMEMYILKHTVFKPPETELFKDSLYYYTKTRLHKDYRLFMFNDDSYITEKVLKNAGISINYIKDFVNKAVEFIEENSGFYTYNMLLEKNFNHKFMDLGFENIFYESIISNSDQVKLINTKPKIFYINDKKNYTYAEFLYKIVENNISLDYQDLIDILNEEYRISIEQNDLKYKLNGTNAYYSNETEKYYYNKEQYLLEVYGKC